MSSKHTHSFSKARPPVATTDLGGQSWAHGRRWAEGHMTYVPHSLLSLLTGGLGQSGWGWAGSTGPGGICPSCATLCHPGAPWMRDGRQRTLPHHLEGTLC